MPELPEVETITQDLKSKITGSRIVGFWTDWPKYFLVSGGVNKNKKVLIDKTILKIERKGKNILFYLSDNYIMAVHLKMTGHFLFEEPDRPSYAHLILDIKKGDKKLKLYFSDVRKFGRILAGRSEWVLNRPEIKSLGREPLEITTADFLKEASKRRGKIKTLLMNQEFLAGVGNIYSDEALYLAKIHPLSRTEKIPQEKLKLLLGKLVGVLKKSLKLRGATRQDYRDISGQKGGYFNQRLVYARKGSKCPCLIGRQACGGIISTVKIGSRAAHFCPKCQKLYQ
jgi:formamidopyrimidine-DNA glycosylase